jgi:hypothetical protein
MCGWRLFVCVQCKSQLCNAKQLNATVMQPY